MYLELFVGKENDARNGTYERKELINGRYYFGQTHDRIGVPIPEPKEEKQEEPKENYIFWIKANSLTKEYPDAEYIWLVGPNFEKKAANPPELRNVGGFFSPDNCINPTNCTNWLAYKEDETKKMGWIGEPKFQLTQKCKVESLGKR